MQLWPLLIVRAAAACAATSMGSASASTRKASDPPSSSTTFLSARPARAPSAMPAASLPVSVTARIDGWSTSASATAEETRRLVNTPSGNPASAKSRSSSFAHPGTFEALFVAAMSIGDRFPFFGSLIERRLRRHFVIDDRRHRPVERGQVFIDAGYPRNDE